MIAQQFIIQIQHQPYHSEGGAAQYNTQPDHSQGGEGRGGARRGGTMYSRYWLLPDRQIKQNNMRRRPREQHGKRWRACLRTGCLPQKVIARALMFVLAELCTQSVLSLGLTQWESCPGQSMRFRARNRGDGYAPKTSFKRYPHYQRLAFLEDVDNRKLWKVFGRSPRCRSLEPCQSCVRAVSGLHTPAGRNLKKLYETPYVSQAPRRRRRMAAAQDIFWNNTS